MGESGDLIQPIQRGEIDADHVVGEIGQLILGECPGRQDAGEVTLFKSVGNTAEDIVAAQLVYENAVRQGLGQQVDL